MRFRLKNFGKIIQSTYLAPILFSMYPILALWTYNFDRLQPIEVVFPLIRSMIVSLALYLVLRLILRNPLKASLLTSLVVLLFYTYGHVYNLIQKIAGIGAQLAHHRYLMLVWLLIFAAGVTLVLKFGNKAHAFNLYLNRVTLILLVIVGVQLIYDQYFQTSVQINHNLSSLQDKTEFDPGRVANKNALPDVYLIVLDSYAREDILKQNFNYDNQPFVKKLTDLGFVIPKCTMSNYAYTVLAMSSELNMHYVDAFYPDINPSATDTNYTVFTDYIRHSLVRENLTALGYKTISFEADAHWVEIPDADIFHTSATAGQVYYRFLDTTEFDDILNASTILSAQNDAEVMAPVLKIVRSDVEDFFAGINNIMKRAVQSPNQNKYTMIMSDLDYMETISNVPGPKLVYLHLPAPHTPQVLGPDGEFIKADRQVGYTYAVTYLNKRIYEIISKIIAQSKVPPVIILQGDHGYGDEGNNRVYNLNAYYLPGVDKSLVYPSITPVNTFRLIFNAYFGGKFELLKDASYLTTESHPMDFQLVPPGCPK